MVRGSSRTREAAAFSLGEACALSERQTLTDVLMLVDSKIVCSAHAVKPEVDLTRVQVFGGSIVRKSRRSCFARWCALGGFVLWHEGEERKRSVPAPCGNGNL